MVATGITADTPVGTPLVGWLVVLGLVSLLTSLVTLLALDGATWLDAKVKNSDAFDSLFWPPWKSTRAQALLLQSIDVFGVGRGCEGCMHVWRACAKMSTRRFS